MGVPERLPDRRVRSSRDELTNALAWSVARQKMALRCQRQLYYQYYGSWKGWEEAAPANVREVYRLKKLTTLPLTVGNAVHAVLARWIRCRTKPGGGFPLDDVLRDVTRELAKARAAGTFLEDEYGAGLTDAAWERAVTRAVTLVRSASGLDIIRRIDRLPLDRVLLADVTQWEWKKIEYERYVFWCVPDLVVLGADDEFVIVDWKIGRIVERDARYQLAAGALFAREKLGRSAARATGIAVDLSTGTMRRFDDLDRRIPNVEDDIASYLRQLEAKLADVSANVADMKQFPMTEERSNCKHCNFQRLCGREAVSARTCGPER